MSTRTGAPYRDEVENDGAVLIYEGHNVKKGTHVPDPSAVDQQLFTPKGTPTQNGRFYRAAEAARNGSDSPELVRVYEKIRSGIWVYNGVFRLVDAWQQESDGRQVCKFRLEATDDEVSGANPAELSDEPSRLIPTPVKREVWKRDQGQCRMCGATTELHFDHIIPFSRGGSSLVPDNIQLLCARHNLEKRDRIE